MRLWRIWEIPVPKGIPAKMGIIHGVVGWVVLQQLHSFCQIDRRLLG